MSQNLTSPSGPSRNAPRRRETTDTNPFPGSVTSPTSAGPGQRFEWLNRKETKDNEAQDEDKTHTVAQESSAKPSGFPSLTRGNTTGTAGFPSTTWAASITTPTTSSGFGGFGNFAMGTPGVSGGSRFFSKKDSSENISSVAGPGATTNAGSTWRPRPRTDTDPFGGDEGLSGSAALGGARDTSPPPMPTTHGSQIFDTPAKGNTSDFGMSGLNLGASRERNASSASPSQTNPYRSPPAERGDNDHDDHSLDKSHGFGGPSEQNSNYGSIRGGFGPPAAAAAAFEGSDRSQTSSVGARNYPPLSNIGGWPSTFSTATPDRERPGFGAGAFTSVFSPMTNEMQSPGLGSMSGVFGPPSSGLGGASSLRGSSKLGSLFPPAMQAQMQNPDRDPLSDSVPDLRQSNPLNAIGAGPIGARDTDSPLSMNRGNVMDIFQPQTQIASPSIFTTAEHNQSLLATAPQNHGFNAAAQASPFGTDLASNGPPPAQSRVMVMPDRMRWMYLDPQGQQQGPFTGLEMNEWYKNNFFTADLRVRKLEDHTYEPLGELIRRIGNSREPFLVPQVGIPHGPPTQAGAFSPSGETRGGVIPPLSGIVPSYGKTLTAEEQNNLERRKQEEQVAMARHREMSQQSHIRPMYPGVTGVLQHQPSVHSLQSQPSYGSIASPLGMPQPQQAPIGANLGINHTAGFFDPSSVLSKGSALPGAMHSGSDQLRADVGEHERQILANLQGTGGVSGMFSPQPVGPPTTDLKSQLPSVDQLERDPEGFKDRLKEFQDYRGIPSQQRIVDEAQAGLSQPAAFKEQADTTTSPSQSDVGHHKGKEPVAQPQHQFQPFLKKAEAQSVSQSAPQTMSLTQQVQKTQADAHRKAQQEEEAWAKQSAASGLPMPFPAPFPAASTPLAAPTAQRRSNIAEQYIDTRSQTHTPDSAAASSTTAAQPPPLAPWAREPGAEAQKGPSLKEIQQAEAKKAAKLEAQRRAQLEQEALAAKEREKANPVVPGLPANSTWGSGSPAPTASSPWSKPAAAKVPATVSTSAANKKTLAEIQREEEARKLKETKDQTPQSGSAPGSASLGKRYAELASKTGPPGIATAATAAAAMNAAATTTSAGGWSTVGAGGRVKVPPAPQPRAVSASTVRPTVTPAVVKPQVRPVAPPASRATSVSEAHAALAGWVKGQLSKALKPDMELENVVETMMDMGTDKELIESILYQSVVFEQLDVRQVSQEFLQRKKQAEKGIFEPASVNDAKSAASGGWSEVAKKGGSSSQVKEPEVVGFKVVPRKNKKK